MDFFKENQTVPSLLVFEQNLDSVHGREEGGLGFCEPACQDGALFSCVYLQQM